MIEIGTLDDPRLDGYRQLRDPHALAADGLFVAEGRLVVARLLALAATPGRWRGMVASVLLTPAAYDHLQEHVAAHPDVPVYVLPQQVMNDVVGFNIHRGCLALARRPAARPLSDEDLDGARTVVVLDGVNNPDNVGGIFRCGAALGVDLVVLGPGCADPLYRKSVRTSMGAALVLPFANAPVLRDTLAVLAQAGFGIVALTPAIDATALSSWRPGPRVALVAGAEGSGLSADTQEAAGEHVTIPMSNRVDSLNVHTAVAIALYHVQVSRQS